jgi:NADH-quinone oxidoreductase subunit H
MNTIRDLIAFFIFPGGLVLVACALAYEWANRKLVAHLQDRLGPPWFQPLADLIKLLAKDEVVPEQVIAVLFHGLPVMALAGVLTAALYVPLFGLGPSYSFHSDLIVTLYLLGLPTMCIGLSGASNPDRFSLVGATRALTQFFSYEAPFLLGLLGPALVASSWQISEIAAFAGSHWLLLTQPIGFIVTLIGLMGELELPPFDAPEAETEIVAGALTEYSGRGLAFFRLAKDVELVVGLALIAAFYLGGLANPAVPFAVSVLIFFAKNLVLLLVLAISQTIFARLRIDQTVGLWWRYGVLLVLVQWFVTIIWEYLPL